MPKPLKQASAVLLALYAAGVLAQGHVIKDIRLEGIARTEAGTVFSHLPIRVGDTYTAELGAEALRSLYASGMFRDVELDMDGNVLVVRIQERPTVAGIQTTGISEFDKKGVEKSLRDVGLAEGAIFDRSILERAAQELRRQYLTRGHYAVEIKTTVTPVERNRVRVIMDVDEGNVSKIATIRFVGNKVYSDGKLRDEMQLGLPNWLSWYTKRDQYSREKLQGDLEAIRALYNNNGYLDFKIDSTQVSISPDKSKIHITINVNEGKKYRIKDVKLTGDMLGLEPEFEDMIDIKPGSVYNASEVNALGKAITDKLSTLGYAFAKATPEPVPLGADSNEVSIVYLIDPGKRVYVRKVNITGNTRTRDEVIRREVRQYEASWFDSDKVAVSRDRIDRLGFFETVTAEPEPVTGSPDEVDLEVKVKERPTGNISIGAGYSTSEGIIISGGFSQNNAFGTGNSLSVDVNTSKSTRIYSLNFTQPYITTSGISQAFEIYDRRIDLDELDITDDVVYETYGAGVSYGIPVTENDQIFLGGKFEMTDVKVGANAPNRYKEYVLDYGKKPKDVALTFGWSRDTRDNVLAPNSGRYQRVSAEISLPVLDLRYYRATYQFQQYWPITKTFTFAFNTELGYGDGYGGKPYPFFKNFYGGGIGSVRGFESSSLGPRDSDGDASGGNRKFNFSLELLAPIPGADRTLRLFTFLDGGWIWGRRAIYQDGKTIYKKDKLDLGDLRYSVGIGLAWISPMGPLKLSFAIPLNKKDSDELERFQFQIGTGF
ncbi:MAG: outer membrane protein assembly factor BamA [Burkholderiales bacterium]|nr:outer membrane protein assembly factor BamA [Burkholderiales bacterium]